MEVQAQSRKLLHNLPPPSPTYPSSGPAHPDTDRYGAKTSSSNSLNESVVLVLSILLCSLICALVVNVIVRCLLRMMRPTCDDREPPGPLGRPTKTARAARREALRALPARVYSSGLGLAGAGSSECAICLSEFVRGDRVRALPDCNHGFHVRCIDRWLAARPTCPTCRNCLFGPVATGPDRVPAEQTEDIDL